MVRRLAGAAEAAPQLGPVGLQHGAGAVLGHGPGQQLGQEQGPLVQGGQGLGRPRPQQVHVAGDGVGPGAGGGQEPGGVDAGRAPHLPRPIEHGLELAGAGLGVGQLHELGVAAGGLQHGPDHVGAVAGGGGLVRQQP